MLLLYILYRFNFKILRPFSAFISIDNFGITLSILAVFQASDAADPALLLLDRVESRRLPDIKERIVESGPPIGGLGGRGLGQRRPLLQRAEKFNAGGRVSVYG